MAQPIGSLTQLRLSRLYAAREKVSVDFSGGLNNVVDATSVTPKEQSVLNNLEPDGQGGLVQRPTWQYMNDASGPHFFFDILGTYARGDGVTFLVVQGPANHSYLYNPIDFTFIDTGFVGASGCAQYQNRLYLCSQTASGGWWGETIVGSGTYTFHSLASGATPMPKGDQIVAYKDRLWIAGYGTSDEYTKLYLSDITTTVGGDINNWPVLNFIYIGRGDGQRITKLWGGPNDLFILRSTSTWYFHYESDPTTGTLALMNATIGADDKRSTSVYQGTLFSLSNASLYQLVGFQWARRNDPHKIALRPITGTYGFPRGVSTFGDRIIVFNNGGLYVYYPLQNSWSSWSESATHGIPHYSVTFHPQSGSDGTNYIFGLNSVAVLSGGNHISTMSEIIPATNTSETITCNFQTGAQSFGTSSHYKVIYWYAIDAISTSLITGKMFNVASSSIVVTWDTMAASYTWDLLAMRTWDNPTGTLQHSWQDTAKNPSLLPYRLFYRFSRKQRFNRMYFTISTTSDGSQNTGPVRIFAMNAYVDTREQMPAKVN